MIPSSNEEEKFKLVTRVLVQQAASNRIMTYELVDIDIFSLDRLLNTIYMISI